MSDSANKHVHVVNRTTLLISYDRLKTRLLTIGQAVFKLG